MSKKADWTNAALKRQGFKGWVTFKDLADELPAIARTGGIYVVVQRARSKPDFLKVNPGGRFKQRDPTVDAAALEANWVDGAEVVYIGKAVDTLGARDRDHIVSALLEDLDEVRSGPAGGSRDGNLLAPVFGLHRSSFPAPAARRRQV